MTLKSFFICLLGTVLCSCGDTLEKNDLIGIWKSDNGAELIIKDDGTYTAKQISAYCILEDEDFINKKINFYGKWKIGETGNQKKETLELLTNLTFKDFGINRTFVDRDGVRKSDKIHSKFLITGSGILENKKPFIMYINVGDPDEMNKFELKKIN